MIVVYGILAILILLVLVVLIRTMKLKPQAVSAEPLPLDVDGERAAQHLGEAIRLKTVSMATPEECDWGEWRKFHSFLERAYPLMNSRLERETINDYALLYRWKGKDESKLPILLMAHIDVVPVAEGMLSEWKYPPFSGEIAEGYVWGRGAVDMKGSLIAIAEGAGLPLSAMVLAYMLTLPGMGPVIPSGSSEAQLLENAKAGRLQLPQDVKAAIAAALRG